MKIFIAAALGLMLAACEGATGEDVFRSTPADAEFRWLAREMYESLHAPSCAAQPGFRRLERLREELEAVGAFEARLAATPPRFHLDAARSDADYDLALNGGCWSDGDVRFAQRHVEMTRDRVRSSLERMEALVPSLGRSVPAGQAAAAAEFRYLARELVRSSRPRCQLTTTGDNDRIMAPARAEVARFRERLAGTPYAPHFDMAEADVAYEYSIQMVECVDPALSAPAKVAGDALIGVRRQIATLEAKLRLG